jgi:hypothetical protein
MLAGGGFMENPRLEDAFGELVQVYVLANNGHCDVGTIYQGILVGVQDHLIAVKVAITQEEGGEVEVTDLENLMWFNTMCHTFVRMKVIQR